MKWKEALNIIGNVRLPKLTKTPRLGFMVSFEKKEGRTFYGRHFPEGTTMVSEGEKLIKNEKEAWRMAKKFASATDESYVNIYVIDGNFAPVTGYEEKTIRRTPY